MPPNSLRRLPKVDCNPESKTSMPVVQWCAAEADTFCNVRSKLTAPYSALKSEFTLQLGTQCLSMKPYASKDWDRQFRQFHWTVCWYSTTQFGKTQAL